MNMYSHEESSYSGVVFKSNGSAINELLIYTYDNDYVLGSASFYLHTGSSHPYYITDNPLYAGEQYVSNRLFAVFSRGKCLFQFKYGNTDYLDTTEETKNILSICYVRSENTFSIGEYQYNGNDVELSTYFDSLDDFDVRDVAGGKSLFIYGTI